MSHPYNSSTRFRWFCATFATGRVNIRWLHVENVNSSKEAMAEYASRRFVKVAPPTVHAGIGDALRHAYAMNRDVRSLEPFADLLARLD